MRLAVLSGLILLVPVLAWAQAQEWEKSNEAYQGALKAYLEGDFDRAILLDTRAIQMDMKNKKAADLLTVLVQEKEQNHKTEIWIGSDRVVNPLQSLAPILPPTIPVVRHSSKPSTHAKVSSKTGLPAKVTDAGELEGRVETLLLLMGRNASDQYQELTSAQVDTMKKVEANQGQIQRLQDEINRRLESGDNRFNWLVGFQWLALIVALLALSIAYRARLEVRRLRLALEGTPHLGGEKGNVLPLNGTFKP